MAQVTKVQDGTVHYSATDPAAEIIFNIKGHLNVRTDIEVGDGSPVGGTITSRLGQNLTITSESNLHLEPTSALVFNNSVWPVPAATTGQFLASTVGPNLEFITYLLGTTTDSTLTQASLNATYPNTKPGQWVIGTPALADGNYSFAYQSVGNGQWLKLVPGNVSGAGTGTVTSIGISSNGGSLTVTGGPVTTIGTINVELATTGVVAGNYTGTNITVDRFGRVTNASNSSVNAGLLSINSQGGNYTIQLSDATNTLLRIVSPIPATVTLPNDSTADLPVGSKIIIGWVGIGQVTIGYESGVLVETPESYKISKRFGKITAIKTGPNQWELDGNLELL